MMSVLWFVLLCIYAAQSLEVECSSMNPCNGTLLCPDKICILNCQGDSSCVSRIIECNNSLTNGTCTINCNGINSCDNITVYSNTNTILNCNNESSCNVGEIIIREPIIDDINLEINCNSINSCTDINVTTFDKTDVLFNCNRNISMGNVCINNTINCGGMNNICNASCDINDCWRNTINNCDNNICSGFNHNIEPTTTMIPMTTNNIITTETPMNTDATIKAAKIYQRFEEFYRYGYNWLQSQSWIIIGIICGGFGLLLCCCLLLCFYAESRKTKKLVRSLHMMGMVPSMVLNKAAKENRRVSKKIEQIEMVDADDFHDSSDDDNNGGNGPGMINGNNNINNNVIMNDPDRSPVYNPLVSPSVNSDREIEIQKMNQEIERKKREQQKAFDNPHTKKMLLIMQGSKALKQLEQQNQQKQKLKNVASNSSNGMNSNENENENEISITLENVEDNGNNVDKPGQSSALEIFDVIPPMNTETEIELNDYNESNNNTNPKAKSLRKLDKSARIPKEDSLLPNQKSVKNVNKQNNANIDDNPFSDLQMPSNSFNEPPKPPEPPIIPSNDNDVIKSADEDGILFGLMSANQDITDLNNITKDIDKPIDDFKELDKSHIKHVSVPDEDQFKIVGTKENIIITDNNGISKQYVSTKQLNVDGTTNLESAMNEAKMQSQMEEESRQQELERERINEQKNKTPVPNPLDSMPAPPSGPVITEFDDNPPSYDDIVNDKPPSYNDFLGMKPPPTGPVNVDNNDILNNINIQNGDQINVYENAIIDDGNKVVSYQNNQIINADNNDVVSPLDALMNAAQPSPLNDVIQASNTVPINEDNNNNTDNNDDSDSDGGFVVKQASEVNIESSDSEIDIKKTNLSNIGNGGAQYKSPFSDNDNVQTYKSPLDANYSETDSSDDPERNVKPMFKSQAYNNEYNNNENNSDAGTEEFNPDAGYGTDPNNYSN